MAGLSTLSATISTEFRWQAALNLVGSAYNPIQNSGDIRGSQNIATTSANNVSGGGDEIYSFQQGIAANSSATLDLSAMTDILQRSSSGPARIKGFQIRLLSGANDTTISPVPTATSTVTVTNIGPAVPSPLDFGNGGSGGTVTLTGTGAVTGVAVGAGGTGYPVSAVFLASPQQTGGSGCVFLCTTNASGVITATTFITGAGGSGYTAATVPLVPVGQYNILTGGAHMYFDPSATGVVVGTASKNIKFYNMDSANAVTLELDFLGGSS